MKMKASFYRYMLGAFAAATLAAASIAQASAQAPALVDLAKSSIIATSKQMNVPVDGKFTKFTAQISFDPAKPTAGNAQFTIDVASYDLGDKEYNTQVAGPDWFDAKRYPSATFVSSAIAAVGGNKYTVSGKLTIKGKTQNVAIPVTVTQQAGTQVFDGALPIKRLQFDIGTGEWKDTSVVADEVTIKFHIVAAKKS